MSGWSRQPAGWHDALLAAGVEVGEKPQPHRQWTRQGILEEIQARYRQSLPLRCDWPWLDLCLENNDLARAAKRVCRSWRRAIIAVEGSPETKPPMRNSKWNPERIIECVRQRHEAGKPMHYTAIRVENNPLLCAARYHFGSWPNALAAAGIEPEQPMRAVKKGGSF